MPGARHPQHRIEATEEDGEPVEGTQEQLDGPPGHGVQLGPDSVEPVIEQATEPEPGSVCSYCSNEPFWQTANDRASKIYMCPDHRGEVTIEAIEVMPGKTPPPEQDGV